MNLEKKLDKIIKRLNKIEEKISNIDSKIDVVSEVKFENRSKVDTMLDTKADIDLIKQLNQKIISFEEF